MKCRPNHAPTPLMPVLTEQPEKRRMPDLQRLNEAFDRAFSRTARGAICGIVAGAVTGGVVAPCALTVASNPTHLDLDSVTLFVTLLPLGVLFGVIGGA